MSFLGAYLGLTPAAPTLVVVTPPAPVPVTLPAQTDNLEFVDHVAVALSRLAEQFKAKN